MIYVRKLYKIWLCLSRMTELGEALLVLSQTFWHSFENSGKNVRGYCFNTSTKKLEREMSSLTLQPNWFSFESLKLYCMNCIVCDTYRLDDKNNGFQNCSSHAAWFFCRLSSVVLVIKIINVFSVCFLNILQASTRCHKLFRCVPQWLLNIYTVDNSNI